ncbi:MAG: hypothetical protein ACI81T_003077 [Bacteroidia bacterium]|jgi:hypothetical protein
MSYQKKKLLEFIYEQTVFKPFEDYCREVYTKLGNFV